MIRKAMQRPEIYNEEMVRNEMFLNLDYYVTELSGHNSEYNWWFRKRQDLIEKYCTHGTGWNPGEYAYILKEYQNKEATWKEEAKKWFAQETPISLERGHEYAAHIINALKGGDVFAFNGNVPNKKLITNLPDDVCVEIPVFVDKGGLHTTHVGDLPPQCVALNHVSVMVEEMAVEAALTGDARMAFHAICYDPADRRRAVAGRDQDHGQRNVPAKQGLSPAFQGTGSQVTIFSCSFQPGFSSKPGFSARRAATPAYVTYGHDIIPDRVRAYSIYSIDQRTVVPELEYWYRHIWHDCVPIFLCPKWVHQAGQSDTFY